MRTLDAINAGYDEITHIYFATMNAMPDDVVAKSNTTLRMLGPGKYFKDVDFDAEPTKTVIRTMAEKKIVLDPTLVVVEGVLLANAGKVSPAYAPYIGTLPAATERGFLSGHIPYLPGMTRDDAEKSVHHMGEYVAKLRRSGVPIVAGTDGFGMELVREHAHRDGARGLAGQERQTFAALVIEAAGSRSAVEADVFQMPQYRVHGRRPRLRRAADFVADAYGSETAPAGQPSFGHFLVLPRSDVHGDRITAAGGRVGASPAGAISSSRPRLSQVGLSQSGELHPVLSAWLRAEAAGRPVRSGL